MFHHLRQVVNKEQMAHITKMSKWNDAHAKLRARTHFLIQCRDRKVTPPSLRVKAPLPSPRLLQATSTFQTAVLRAAIRDNYAKMQALNNRCTGTDLTFLPPDELDQLRTFLLRRFERLHAEKQTELENKLQRLTPKLVVDTTTPTLNPITNFTTTLIPDPIVTLLELGPKFNLNNRPVPLIDVIAPLEAQLQHHQEYTDETRQRIARLLTTATHVPTTPTYDTQAPRILRQFLKDNPNILLLHSDKGGTPVFMSKTAYTDKILSLLQDDTTFRKEKYSYNAKMTTAVGDLIHAWTTAGFISEEQGLAMKISCPLPPRIHGLPKLHKEGTPLRPIVDFRNSPTYFLAKFLGKSLLRSNIPDDRSCSNSYEFLRTLRDHHDPPGDDYSLVSFDVTSLFTNVPIDVALQLISKHWEHIQPNTPLTLAAFQTGISLCAEATVIQFNGQFFRQIFGCPMGSSLSGALANLVMIDLENHALSRLSPTAMRIYKRYVDDIFALMLRKLINQFLKLLNSYHPRLQFTVEHEVNGQLPFLDVMVTRSESTLTTTVYTKPTSNQRYLDYLSPSPINHKIATARALLARAIYYPSKPEEVRYQTRFWCAVLRANHYPNGFLQRILIRIRQAPIPSALQLPEMVTTAPELAPTPPQWVAIPYVPHLHQRLQALMPTNVRLAPVAHDQIRSLYSCAKDTTPEESTSNVIYAIHCKPLDGTKCNNVYIGQTSLSLHKRIGLHRSKFTVQPLASSLFAHVSSQPSEHVIDFDHPNIIDRTAKRKELPVREAWAINNTPHLINATLEKSHLPGPYRGLQKAVNNQFVTSRGLIPHDKRTQQWSTAVTLRLVPQPESVRIRQARNLTQWPNPSVPRLPLPTPAQVQPPAPPTNSAPGTASIPVTNAALGTAFAPATNATLGLALREATRSANSIPSTSYNLRKRH